MKVIQYLQDILIFRYPIRNSQQFTNRESAYENKERVMAHTLRMNSDKFLSQRHRVAPVERTHSGLRKIPAEL